MLARQDPENILDTALAALSAGPDCKAMLDALPVPIYTTDATGQVTFWNLACLEFAGREPELGQDRWCVTWQLYTTAGERLNHEDSPTAQAIRHKRPVRDSIAIAERPDGSRVAFRAYPTPIFADAGRLTGAINMLIDVSDEQSQALLDEAERCRRFAAATYDRATGDVLVKMADGFERTAADLARKSR